MATFRSVIDGLLTFLAHIFRAVVQGLGGDTSEIGRSDSRSDWPDSKR
jgi:hypothetical protein